MVELFLQLFDLKCRPGKCTESEMVTEKCKTSFTNLHSFIHHVWKPADGLFKGEATAKWITFVFYLQKNL